jgi:outer membrane protein assembly factor BamB
LLLCCVLLSSHVSAQLPAGPDDYPQWRGPNRDGISADKGLLKEWPEGGPPIAWQVDHVGVGYSSIAIKDGLIVTMGDLGGVEHVIALRAKDGSRVWAVQPEPMSAALAERVDREFTKIDRNEDGKVDEVEALAGLGWDFYKHDRGADQLGDIAARAGRVFAALDADGDGRLTYAEAGNQLRDQFGRIDTADQSKAAELAQSRAAELIAAADADNDGKVSRKESRTNYLDRIFSRADERDPQSRKGDDLLTREEVAAYFTKREAGQDGVLTAQEVADYYRQNVTSGDGFLSRDELQGIYGGYRNGMGDGPRGTPTIDGDRVYAEGGNGDVTCLDLQTGKTIWHVSLTGDLGGGRPGWGYSESPLVVGDLVIVTPGGKQGTLAALHKMTGNVIWQSDQNTEAAHYSSPIVAEIGGVKQIVQFARQTAFGVTLDDGKLLWQYSGANNGTANCCTPIVDQDHVFVASAYGTGGGLAKISSDGGAQTAEEVYFEKKMAIHHGGIVKIGDYLYSNGGGTLICINFLSGDIAWQDRSVGKGSLVAADGMLYVLSEKQELALVEATPEEYREHGRIKMESQGRPSWAHPVVAGGRLYVRDQQMLTAYELR